MPHLSPHRFSVLRRSNKVNEPKPPFVDIHGALYPFSPRSLSSSQSPSRPPLPARLQINRHFPGSSSLRSVCTKIPPGPKPIRLSVTLLVNTKNKSLTRMSGLRSTQQPTDFRNSQCTNRHTYPHTTRLALPPLAYGTDQSDPVVDRIQRTARKTYLTYISPRVPYIQSKINSYTAPWTSHISALHRQHVAPHLNVAQGYANAGTRSGIQAYQAIAGHPVTGQLAGYANAGARQAGQRGYDAYTWSRPHATRLGREADRVAREVLGPRVASGLGWGATQAGMGWNFAAS